MDGNFGTDFQGKGV